MKHWFVFFLLLLIGLCVGDALCAREVIPAKELPAIILTGEDTSFLLPPFDPQYDTSLALSPRLGLLSLPYQAPGFVPPVRETELSLFLPVPEENPRQCGIGVGLDTRPGWLLTLNTEPGNRRFSSSLEFTGNLFFESGDEGLTEGHLFNLEWLLIPRMRSLAGELELDLALVPMEREKQVLIHTGHHSLRNLPGGFHSAHLAEWMILWGVPHEPDSLPLYYKERLLLDWENRFRLSRLDIQFLLAGDAGQGRYEGVFLVAPVREFFPRTGSFNLEAGITMLTDFKKWEWGPNFLCRWELPHAFFLEGEYSANLQGPAAPGSLGEALPLSPENPVASYGWTGELGGGGSIPGWIDGNCQIGYAKGKFQQVGGESISIRDGKAWELDVNLRGYFPAGIRVNLDYVRGLGGEAAGNFWHVATSWNHPRNQQCVALTFSHVISPSLRYPGQQTGTRGGVEGLWSLTKHWVLETKGEINFDESYHYLDFNLCFSIVYNLMKE